MAQSGMAIGHVWVALWSGNMTWITYSRDTIINQLWHTANNAIAKD